MKTKILIPLAAVILASGAFWYHSSAADPAARNTVELSVSRMTCGSCVETIRESVSALDGTADIVTDVQSARSLVAFDADRVAPETIAEAVTRSGYPATVLFVRAPSGEVVDGIDLDRYLARIGSELIPRDAFQQIFDEILHDVERSGKAIPFSAVSNEAWQILLHRNLLLQAAAKFGVSVDESAVDRAVAGIDGDTTVDRDRVRDGLIIDRFLTLQFPEAKPDRQALSSLIAGLRANIAVDIFDENLKRQLAGPRNGSGCACCNS